MIIRRRLVAVCALAGLLLTLALASSAQAAPRALFGVSPQSGLSVDDFARMQQARVGTLRYEVFWAGANPEPNEYRWGASDFVFRHTSLNGIRVLPFVYSTPHWVAQREGRKCQPSACLAFAPQKRAGLRALNKFLTEFVNRYGRGGTFWAENPDVPATPVRAVQIWNEQNSPTFYRPKPNVRKYAKLLRTARKAIKRADRRVDVIMGGMFGTPFGARNPDGVTAWDYLRKLYRVRGVKRDFDAIAPHPYGARMKLVRKQVKLLLRETRRARDRNVQMWVTEIGWGSARGSNPLNRGRRGQAQRLRQAFELFLSKRRAWKVKNITWYSWRDNTNSAGLCSWCPFSGLLTEDYSPKPSYRAFTRLSGGR